ncbi:MAG: hypothetical protein JOZ57_15645, partial [Abitibacteriaceae bacterium]|nr:hypothetical protein [Abditibacteriaceae bacterium]
TTDAQGYYNFESVAPGTYVVGPIAPNLLFNFATVSVSSSVNVPNLNFAGVRLNSVTGSTRSSRSKVVLSTAVAHAASQSIVLQFTGQLDPNEAAEPAHYSVKINGREVAVESVSYRSAMHTVVLGLAEGALRNGDKVVVALTDLLDAKGATVSGQVGPLTVK